MKLRILPALVVVVCAACAFAERPGDFRVIGPGGGGAMFNPTISPHDTNTVLISCDMTGSYITHDAGQTWRMFNLRGVADFFVFDPRDPQTMYVHETGLWRSSDGGEQWKLVYPDPGAVTGVQMNSDHSDEHILADPDPLGEISALAVDPGDSNILYAAAFKKEHFALFVSRDYGKTWQKQADLPARARRIWVDPHSPAGARTLFMASSKAFIASSKAVFVVTADKVRSLPLPETANDLSLGFASDAQATLYATSEKGVFVSTDGGATWNKKELPGQGAQVRAIATSLHHPEVAYVSYAHLALDAKFWIGVAKTTNSGKNWQLVWKEADTGGKNIHDAWITERFGPGWGENPLNLAVAEQDPNLAYGTDLGRTMKTIDGGTTWTALYSRKVDNAGWTTVGLDVTNSYGIHFDPFDAKRQFITYTDIGLFRSEDGGTSWKSSTTGVPRQWLNTTYWVIFDPKVKGRMWSVNSYTHDLPRPKMWRHNSVTTYKGGVCRSNDGGTTWTKSNDGMEETAATHILLDPKSPVNARVLYVAGFGRGIYKSSDDGRTWTLKNQGITQSQPFVWRLALSSDGAIYAVIARRSEDGSIGNAGDGALYRSTDGAEHWQPIKLPEGTNGPNGISVDPRSPNRLYLATWAKATGLHGDGGGVFLSEDGGKSWKRVLEKDRHVYDVTTDPSNPAILYSAGFESSAWRSADRGLHWTRIPGFNFKWGQRVIPDPQDHSKIYITTFGGSVWHGSVNGENRPVDIATAVLEPGQ
ncbi:MAG: hypothetical protein DMG70_10705 [Acidobacteria bacterium]|nr:MAG: hypothetical protein DMG70_10705 [Acidobacteriota bacterium]PYY04619.1 MAG: hypothetical protein DMG69_29810 [Acidobacteriota bacterium]